MLLLWCVGWFMLSGISADKFNIVYHYQVQPDTQAVNDLLDESLRLIDTGDFRSARKKVDQARRWSEEIDYKSGKQHAALNLADIYLNIQFFDSAEVLLEQTLESYPESEIKINLQNLLATAYRYQNKTEESVEMYQMILEESGTSLSKRMEAGIRQNLAVAYNNMGKKAEAIENFLVAIEYAEAEKDTVFWVIILNNIGDAYNDYDERERAEFYLEKAIRISREKGLRTDLLRATMNLANTKTNMEKPGEALDLYNQALDLHKEVRPNTPPFQILYNMGNLFLQTGELEKAESNFMESLQYCRQLSIPPGIYFNSTGLGLVAEERENYEQALIWFKEANEIAFLLNSDPFITSSLEKLYQLNKELGNYQSALENLEKYKTLSDSLVDLDKERQFSELESQLELRRQTEINALLEEKQEQQATQLRFQYMLLIAAAIVILLILYILYTTNQANKLKTENNVRLRKHQEELQNMNAQMNKLFAIIAHDLRSPLSTMKGLIYMMKAGDLKPEESGDFVEEIERAIQRNIDVMEDLFSWAKEQMSGIELDQTPVNIKSLVDQVISKQKTEAEAKQISVTNQIKAEDGNVLGDKKALTLIFRNLLSNSIKFTEASDEISFTSKSVDGKIEICVIDTGIGMSEEVQEKVFSKTSISYSREGTKGEKGTGFGLSLVKEFVSKLGGSIRIQSKEGEGTRFCIRFPKA